MTKFYSFSEKQFVVSSDWEDRQVSFTEKQFDIGEMVKDPAAETEKIKRVHKNTFEHWLKAWDNEKQNLRAFLYEQARIGVRRLLKYLLDEALVDSVNAELLRVGDRIFKYIETFFEATRDWLTDEPDPTSRQFMLDSIRQFEAFLSQKDFLNIRKYLKENYEGFARSVECNFIKGLIDLDVKFLEPFHPTLLRVSSACVKNIIREVKSAFSSGHYQNLLQNIKSEYMNYQFWQYAKEELARMRDIVLSQKSAARIIADLRFTRNSSVNTIVYHNLLLHGINKYLPSLSYLLNDKNEI